MPHTDIETKQEAQRVEFEQQPTPTTFYCEGVLYHDHADGTPMRKATVGQLIDADLGFAGEAFQWCGSTAESVPAGAVEWSKRLIDEHGLPESLDMIIDEWITQRWLEHRGVAAA